MSEPSNIIAPARVLAFFNAVGKLKRVKRQGWINNGIDRSSTESVADHSYRMAMMSFLVSDKDIDRTKLMKICLVHDLAEADPGVGDITPDQKISSKDKTAMETAGLQRIVDNIGDSSDPNVKLIQEEIFSLWREYEGVTTKEAKYAKQLDKLEMIIQADEYEKEYSTKLETFFKSTAKSFDASQIGTWNEELRRQRSAYDPTSGPGGISRALSALELAAVFLLIPYLFYSRNVAVSQSELDSQCASNSSFDFEESKYKFAVVVLFMRPILSKVYSLFNERYSKRVHYVLMFMIFSFIFDAFLLSLSQLTIDRLLPSPSSPSSPLVSLWSCGPRRATGEAAFPYFSSQLLVSGFWICAGLLGLGSSTADFLFNIVFGAIILARLLS